jgi:hypothetical protein
MVNLCNGHIEFRTDEELIESILSLSESWSGKTVVMAGHHLVVYRRSTKKLVPLATSQAYGSEGTLEEKGLVGRVGDFAEHTFDLGGQLLGAMIARGQNARLSLLINDHQFRVLQEDLPNDEDLRKSFYHSLDPLPEFLMNRWTLDFPIEELMDGNHRERSEDSPLPSRSFVYSETSLRKRFARTRKQQLASIQRFACEGDSGLVYRFSDTEHLSLVADSGFCGCAGDLVEYLLELADMGAENVILFTPVECRSAVDPGIRCIMEGLGSFRNVISVWGGVDLVKSHDLGKPVAIMGDATVYTGPRL